MDVAWMRHAAMFGCRSALCVSLLRPLSTVCGCLTLPDAAEPTCSLLMDLARKLRCPGRQFESPA